MPTTAGSLALRRLASRDGRHVAARLRRPGAVILGKANLTEWANFRSLPVVERLERARRPEPQPVRARPQPVRVELGLGRRGGGEPRAVAIGTETDGSIVCPARANGVVGIKPTVGLTSRAGIIPISRSQDTAGPMARTVADAAAVLGALAGVDPRDPATAASAGNVAHRLHAVPRPRRPDGARIGVCARAVRLQPGDRRHHRGASTPCASAGAVIVDPASSRRSPRCRRRGVQRAALRVQGRHQRLPRRPRAARGPRRSPTSSPSTTPTPPRS